MQQTREQRATSRQVTLGRAAVVALAAGTLAAPVLALGPAGAATHATKVTVSAKKTAKFGTVLVSAKTLYTLAPSKTPCRGQCLVIWPPLLLPKGVTHATAGSGVTAAKLGTVHTKSGLQVTYGGKALYFYYKDHAAGQVNGNITDQWGKWTAVVTAKPHSSSGSGSSSSGSGGSNTGTGGVAF